VTELPIADEDLRAVLGSALRHGGHWAEVYLEHRITKTLRLAGGGVAEIRSDLDLGAGVRVVTSARAGYAYTNVVTRRSLIDAAEAAAVASGAVPAVLAKPACAVGRLRVPYPVWHRRRWRRRRPLPRR